MTAPSRLASWDDLRDFGVDYRAPSGVEDVSTHVDCVCSNEVLEHIDRASLERIAAHSLKLVRLSGLGVHSIDYGDHFARSDQAIDRFNFLRFDASEWARHNSRMQYVNRLRPSDYEALFADAGWKIRSALRTPGRPTTTTRENVASEFRHYEDADLFALSGRIVLSA